MSGYFKDNADGQGGTGNGDDVIATLLGFNGSTWDRLRAAADNGDALAVVTLGALRTVAAQMLFNGTTFDRARGAGDDVDALAAIALGVQRALAQNMVFNGATWDRQRTPNVFKTLSAAAIGTEATIWTPTAGKKFRLMGFLLAQGVATGAVTLRDNTGGTTIYIIPAHTIGVVIPPPNLGNGILSGAINRVLTAQGVATETITGVVFGTEE